MGQLDTAVYIIVQSKQNINVPVGQLYTEQAKYQCANWTAVYRASEIPMCQLDSCIQSKRKTNVPVGQLPVRKFQADSDQNLYQFWLKGTHSLCCLCRLDTYTDSAFKYVLFSGQNPSLHIIVFDRFSTLNFLRDVLLVLYL